MSATVRPAPREGAQTVEPVARDRARGHHLDIGRGGTRDGDGAVDLGPIGEIRLRQHHDRRGPALEREHELPFEATEVRPVVQRLHDEHEVDVRGHDLRPA